MPASKYDAGRLSAALRSVPAGEWSEPSTLLGTGVHHGYRQLTLVLATHPQRTYFDWLLEDFAPVHGAWLSWIEPGGFILPHQDAGPWHERWQVPIQAAGHFRGILGSAVPGRPFRVEHWNKHSVWNDTESPRIHLVIDRDVVAVDADSPFLTYPSDIPEPYRHLVEAARGVCDPA